MAENEAPETASHNRLMLDRKEVAEVVYKDLKAAQRAAFDLAGSYGRWLLASLLLAHGGGLVGVVGLFKEAMENPSLVHALAGSAWWLVCGFLLALSSGLSVWFNWSMHATNYQNMARPEMLWDPEQWVGEVKNEWLVDVTYWLGVILGILSAACIPGAAWSALQDL